MNTETKDIKVRYLRAGMLAAPAVVTLKGEPQAGQFGKMNLNFDLEGQNFILSVSPQNPEYHALEEAFGDSWKGKRIRISDGKILKGVHVEVA